MCRQTKSTYPRPTPKTIEVVDGYFSPAKGVGWNPVSSMSIDYVRHSLTFETIDSAVGVLRNGEKIT